MDNVIKVPDGGGSVRLPNDLKLSSNATLVNVTSNAGDRFQTGDTGAASDLYNGDRLFTSYARNAGGTYLGKDWTFNNVSNPIDSDTITATYNNVGTYKDQPISATITMKNITKSKFDGGVNQIGFDLNTHNLTVVEANISRAELVLTFIDQNGNPIPLSGNGYLSVLSLDGAWIDSKGQKVAVVNALTDDYDKTALSDATIWDIDGHAHEIKKGATVSASADNPGEYTAYNNTDSSLNKYVAGKANILAYRDPVLTNATVYGGKNRLSVPSSASESDKLRGTSYTGLTFQLSGTEHNFTMGTTLVVGQNSTGGKTPVTPWNATQFLTATLGQTVTPKPEKTVTDPDNNNADLNGQTVKARKKVTFNVVQKANKLNTDTLERYSDFGFKDVLPKGFDYIGATLTKTYNDKTETVTNAGEARYDDSTRTVSLALSKNYLETMSMDGETYTLSISGYVDATTTDQSKLANSAVVTINDKPTTSNQVAVLVDNTPIKPSVVKQVSTDGQNWGDHADIDYDKDYYYRGVISVPNTAEYSGKSVAVRENISNLQTYKDFQVTDENGNDVLDQGKLSTVKDGELTRIVWTANKPDDWYGRKLTLSLTARLAKLNATDKDNHYNDKNNRVEITNTIDLLMAGTPTPSNETSVTPPIINQAATKYVEK